ncbi:DUF2505 domain-containing protein [Pseudomonas sp. J452]|nr:DUF2505 domain-containing protein [Pseudomonas sp. J452]
MAMVDLDLIVMKYAQLGARKIAVKEHATRSDQVHLKVSRLHPAPSDLPSMFSKLANEWNHITYTETWDLTRNDQWCAAFSLDIRGLPIKIAGTLALMDVRGGCRHQIDLTVSCSIPFIGKAITQYLQMDAERHLAREHQIIAQQLAGEVA